MSTYLGRETHGFQPKRNQLQSCPSVEHRQFRPQCTIPRRHIDLKLNTVSSKNLFYIKDISQRFKILVDTGAGISIFKRHMFKTTNRL